MIVEDGLNFWLPVPLKHEWILRSSTLETCKQNPPFLFIKHCETQLGLFSHESVTDRSAHLLSAHLCISVYLEITHKKEQEFHWVSTLFVSFVAAFGLEGKLQYGFVCLDFKVCLLTEW